MGKDNYISLLYSGREFAGEYNRVVGSDIGNMFSRVFFADEPSGRVFNRVDPVPRMKDIFNNLEIDTNFSTVNRVRVNLTTTAFPYLKAVHQG